MATLVSSEMTLSTQQNSETFLSTNLSPKARTWKLKLLHVAANSTHFEVTKFLAEAAGSRKEVINCQNVDGWAPMHRTSVSRNRENVHILFNLGPILLKEYPIVSKDNHVVEKPANFHWERSLEGVVHIRSGASAKGFFEVSQKTCADFLRAQNPMIQHLSTVLHEPGSLETLKGPHGFAVKLHTREGNFDLLVTNFPVSLIRDGIKCPDMEHAHMPNPKSHIQENWRNINEEVDPVLLPFPPRYDSVPRYDPILPVERCPTFAMQTNNLQHAVPAHFKVSKPEQSGAMEENKTSERKEVHKIDIPGGNGETNGVGRGKKNHKFPSMFDLMTTLNYFNPLIVIMTTICVLMSESDKENHSLKDYGFT